MYMYTFPIAEHCVLCVCSLGLGFGEENFKSSKMSSEKSYNHIWHRGGYGFSASIVHSQLTAQV